MACLWSCHPLRPAKGHEGPSTQKHDIVLCSCFLLVLYH